MILAGIRAAGIEAWHATRAVRRMLVAATASSTAIALVDWHWASMNGQDSPSGDLLTPLTIAFATVLVLTLLTLARPALHLGVRLLAADVVRSERQRISH